MIRKFFNGLNTCLVIILIGLFVSCEENDTLVPEPEQTNSKVETINGFDDPLFLELVDPLTKSSQSGRILEEADYTAVKKVTGDGYTNYTLTIDKLNETPFASHSLIMSMNNDTARQSIRNHTR